MLKSYRATITGNRIQWNDEIPPEVLGGKPVKVLVTILEQLTPNPERSSGPTIADSIELDESLAE